MIKHQLRQSNSTRDRSWSNQLRRPVPKGLARGERLSQSTFPTAAAFSEWGWVGTEVNAAEDISPQHRAAACGFRKHICKNNDDEPECSVKACKANPNCCNHLGQQNWESEATARKSYLEAAGLGDDPKASARNPGLPVGLKNLGATCYANAFLQVWFQDIAFRAGVYSCVPELSLLPGKSVEESPIYQLQMTFGALQHSEEKAFNPVKLVECLGIRTGEQQDAQEFSKLFMSHLDNEFKKQENISVRSLATDQFEGRQVYGTRCATCQNASEHQSNFLELEISLTSDCKLEDRLKANLEDEKLDGDNRYDCSTCGSKQDAFRYLRLTHLPPVLHFSREVLKSAQVFDVTRNTWFQFNDEEVRELKLEDLIGKQMSGKRRSQASKDAYMLIYAQRDVPSLDVATLKIPKHVFDAVQQLNEEYVDSCEAYVRKKRELESEFSLLRQRKREIYQTWEISDVDEVSMVLNKSTLEHWILKELDKATFNPRTRKLTETSQPASTVPPNLYRSGSSPSPPSSR
ncbi:hypothetical protein OPQ81_006550 [Rhizoctonia solani]|nr:hypothetical protein OPQ81_006550 [Rhizoctonia solani]